MKIIGVILAGGSGTRLWPLSRKYVPKQLLNLTGNRSLIQETSRRISPIISKENQWVITNSDLYHMVQKQMNASDPNNTNNIKIDILKEPQPKNTAPAILWAAFKCRKMYGDDSVMVVLPSDHLIIKEAEFIEALNIGISKAAGGNLVTFGILPTYPETGYGYIKTTESLNQNDSIYTVDRFVEKPNTETANEFINEGKYLWNSGVFIFHIGTLLEEASKYCSETYEAFSKIDPDDEKQIADTFNRINPVSIDYAIMEHTKKAYVVQADIGWSDVGNWKSLYEASPKDSEGNVIIGDHITIDTKDSYIYGKDRLIVTMGLSDITIVDTADALLIAPLDQTSRIREVVDQLRDKNSNTRIEHLTVERPWGEYKILQTGPGYKIKKIVVLPGEILSKHFHHHRSEHWIVVRGTAKVTRGEEEILIHENESTYIPISTVHRLENPGKLPLEIIETQCGSYVEEDDIVRVNDVYNW